MSRLYISHDTDAGGHSGKEHVSATIYYGSSNDSKLAVHVDVYYMLGEDFPLIKIKKGKEASITFVND